MITPYKAPTVVIFQYRLFHYRTELFEQMRRMLGATGVQLEVVYGQAFGKESLKKDEGRLSWGHRVKNLYIPIKEKKDLCWQPLPKSIRNPDLVIFMQENRLLANYYWMIRSKFGKTKVAYWGHGRDFQSRTPRGLREKLKMATINAVDWWFAYTSITVDILKKSAFPADRITLLNNSIDIAGFREDADAVSAPRLASMRAEMGIAEGAPVGLFCGSIYPDKKPELLISAADLIHSAAPQFHLIVIGDGQSADVIREATATRSWLHWVGTKRGVEKAAYFKLASVVLNPGAVGLHVLDSFALGLPMITTSSALHGPEIAYLNDGVTGFTTSDDPIDYSEHVLKLIRSPVLAQEMRNQCLLAGQNYSVQNMASNFVGGILGCLEEKKGLSL